MREVRGLPALPAVSVWGCSGGFQGRRLNVCRCPVETWSHPPFPASSQAELAFAGHGRCLGSAASVAGRARAHPCSPGVSKEAGVLGNNRNNRVP